MLFNKKSAFINKKGELLLLWF